MEIRLKTGARLKAKVEVAYAELERIRTENGGDLELATLVAESKPKDAPLHGEFDWHGPTAANKWRLQQARYVVRSIEVIPDESDNAVRKYQSVRLVEQENQHPAKAKQVFRSVEEVLADPDTRDELLAQAIRDALSYKRRYNGLQELAKVFAAFDEVLMEIQA